MVLHRSTKTENFLNLCYHHTDFDIATEWLFSAISHGKGACDGVGGTVKRLAARASLQSHQITTPHQLYEWAQANIQATVFHYCSQDDYDRMDIFLKDRFEKSRTITGTKASLLHTFVNKYYSNESILLKPTSKQLFFITAARMTTTEWISF